MFSFKYSVRPNTLASKRMTDDVTEVEKTDRIVALQALQRDIQTRLYQAAVGSVAEVLIDSASRRRAGEISGRTSSNAVVNVRLPADTAGHEPEWWIGRTVRVAIETAGPHSLSGEPVTDGGAHPC